MQLFQKRIHSKRMGGTPQREMVCLMVLYRIRNWSSLFETAESRKRLNLPWVAIPTKHDGKGYRRLMREFGPAVYGAWILIVAVAAKCPTRGTLADADGPLSALDISDKTDCPVAVIEQALSVLTNERIGWLESVDTLDEQQIDTESAVTSAEYAAMPVLPDQTRPDQTLQNQTGTGRGGAGVSAKPPGRNWGRSAFTNLSADDLVQCEVMFDWFDWATTKAPSPICRRSGGNSEVNLLRVFGSAERAIEESETPLKLFKHIVGGEKWKLITQAQEDRARKRIAKLKRESAQ